jgi:hypothetical protein
MKKLFIVLFILILCFPLVAQQPTLSFGPWHGLPIEKQFQITSGVQSTIDKDSIFVQFPSKGGNLLAAYNYGGIISDTLTSGETISNAGWQPGREVLWTGFCEVDLSITNTDLATDSLQVMVYALDEDGSVRVNDYVYLDFSTPPTYSTSASTLSWTSTYNYRGSVTGAFGLGTFGLLFIINSNDATSSHTGVGTLKIYQR